MDQEQNGNDPTRMGRIIKAVIDAWYSNSLTHLEKRSTWEMKGFLGKFFHVGKKTICISDNHMTNSEWYTWLGEKCLQKVWGKFKLHAHTHIPKFLPQNKPIY